MARGIFQSSTVGETMPIADEASPLYGHQTLLAEGSEIYEEIFDKQLIIFLKPEQHYAPASCEEWNRLLKKELALYNIICLKADGQKF